MKKRIALLCLVLCLLAPLAALAQPVEPDHGASLTLRVTESFGGIPGVRFDVYRVAAVDAHGAFTLLAGYDAGDTDINHVEGAQAWAQLAASLAAQTGEPTATGLTDQKGEAVFADVETGLYLAVGHPVEFGGMAYDFAPFMVSVPGKADGVWDYAPVAEVKHTQTSLIRDLRIVKYWQDGNSLSLRPDHIKVGLYCDGQLVSTATLDASNNWSATYEGLESAHEWTVQEIGVPSGYTVSYTESEDAHFIINTLEAKPNLPPNIPQTGLVWWPVPVLAVLGLALIAIGLVLRRKWSGVNE